MHKHTIFKRHKSWQWYGHCKTDEQENSSKVISYLYLYIYIKITRAPVNNCIMELYRKVVREISLASINYSPGGMTQSQPQPVRVCTPSLTAMAAPAPRPLPLLVSPARWSGLTTAVAKNLLHQRKETTSFIGRAFFSPHPSPPHHHWGTERCFSQWRIRGRAWRLLT